MGNFVCCFWCSPGVHLTNLGGYSNSGDNNLVGAQIVQVWRFCLYIRTSDWLPLVRDISGFLIGVLVAYLSPFMSRSSASEI